MLPLNFHHCGSFLGKRHPVARLVLLVFVLGHLSIGGFGNGLTGIGAGVALAAVFLWLSDLLKKRVLYRLVMLIAAIAVFMGLLLSGRILQGGTGLLQWFGLVGRMTGCICVAVSILATSSPGELGFVLEYIKVPCRIRDRILIMSHGAASFLAAFAAVPMAVRSRIGGLAGTGWKSTWGALTGLSLGILDRGFRRGAMLARAMESRNFTGFGPSLFTASSWSGVDTVVVGLAVLIMFLGAVL